MDSVGRKDSRDEQRESYRKYDALMAHINNTVGPNKIILAHL